jgi:hypothetical protein
VASFDAGGRPTARIWTCKNLEGRLIPRTGAGWYAGCGIGRPSARERWAAEVAGRERLQAVNQLAEEIAMITGRTVDRLWYLKREQSRAVIEQRDATRVTADMIAVGERFLAELGSLLDRRRPLLERHRLSGDACLDVARRAISGLQSKDVPAAWNARFDILVGLPEGAWPA